MQINIPNPANDSPSEWSKYILALWNDHENSVRKSESKRVVDYYRNKQRAYLDQALRSIYTDPTSLKSKRRWSQNVTKQIVDALAQCYSCKVKRDIPKVGKKASKLLNEKLFQGINKKMRQANKWLVVERTTLLFSRWSAKKQRIDYRTYHQFEFDIVVNQDSADQDLQGVLLSDFGKELSDTTIVIYTHNNTYWFKGDKLQRVINHDLDILPFVILHAEDPGFDDYLDPDSQLADSNLEINLAISNLLNILQNQAHAVPVLTLPAEMPMAGIDDSNPNSGHPTQVESDRRIDIHDPDKALVLPMGDAGEVPDFKYVQPGSDFNGSIASIKYIQNSLAQTYGVDNGIFNIEVSGSPATVFHVNEKRREAIVGDLQEVFSDAEKELFDISYRLASMSDPSIPAIDVKTFTIDFVSDASIVEQMQSGDVAKLHEQGLIDHVEVIRSHYGDQSRTEAEAFITEMVETEKRINSIKEEPDDIPDTIEQK